jgi:MFS family permease
MLGLTRAVLTLIGVATAVVLVWLAAEIGDDSTADYWALYGLVAAAGLGMALSQLLGGWTKWGWPRLSGTVFLLGFLPALLVAGWVIAAGQPSENWLQEHVVDWSDDLGLGGVVEDLLDLAGPLAFLAGLTFGFTFDTTGPRVVEQDERVEAVATPTERTEIREYDTPTEVANGDERPTAVMAPPAGKHSRQG